MAEYALKTIVKGTKKGGTAYGRLPGTCGAAHRPVCFVSGLLHLLCGEQAAGSLYVLPARSPDGSNDTLAGKRIPESLHPPVVGTEIGRTGYLMKPYQVDAALQTVEQAGELLHMGRRVVHACEHDILEADAPLSAEIVTAQQRYDIAHGKGPLHGHYLRTLFRKGVMKTDGHMHPAFVEQAAQARHHSGGRDSYTGRTPAIPPLPGEYFQRPQHLVGVIQRLPHPHIYHIGKSAAFG